MSSVSINKELFQVSIPELSKKAVAEELSLVGLVISLASAFFIVITVAITLSWLYYSLL